MINLSVITKLKKFSHLTTHTIAVDDVIEIAGAFGKEVDRGLASSLLDAFKTDAVEPMVDWCTNEENILKLQSLMKARPSSVLVACPACAELSTFQLGEIPQVNPHVVCRSCGEAIPLQP
jgi:hypothetical protein